MKIKVIEDENCSNDTIEIRLKSLTPEIRAWIDEFHQEFILGFKRGKAYQIAVNEIIFFETDQDCVYAHTAQALYETKYKLYELEEMLPKYFTRVSKSAIVNIKEIAALDQKLTSSRTISFHHTHKIIYVSRKFYPLLKEKLSERSF